MGDMGSFGRDTIGPAKDTEEAGPVRSGSQASQTALTESTRTKGAKEFYVGTHNPEALSFILGCVELWLVHVSEKAVKSAKLPKFGLNVAQPDPTKAQQRPNINPTWLNIGQTWPNVEPTRAQHTPSMPPTKDQ